MEIERVNEILNSKGVIDVEYKGKLVWINEMDRAKMTVEIEGLKDKAFKQVVNINELYEI